MYRRYPAFSAALQNRHNCYNAQVARILELERDGNIFVIRPESPLDIRRLETDPEEVQRVYDRGRSDGRNRLHTLKNWRNA